MAADTLYLVFCQNTSTREEFTVPFASKSNNHAAILDIAAKSYPAPQYKVFTAYTIEELQKTLETYKRWGTIPTHAKAENATQHTAASTATPQARLQKNTTLTQEEETKTAITGRSAEPTSTSTVSAVSSASKPAQTSDSSPLLALLKEMQKARPATGAVTHTPATTTPHSNVNVPIGAAAALRAEIAKKEAANPPPKAVLDDFPFGASAKGKPQRTVPTETFTQQPHATTAQQQARDMFGRVIEPKPATTTPKVAPQQFMQDSSQHKPKNVAASTSSEHAESVIARLKAMRLQQATQ